MSSGNKMKVADQKFIFCQFCFYIRPFSLFQRNMKSNIQWKEYTCTYRDQRQQQFKEKTNNRQVGKPFLV